MCLILAEGGAQAAFKAAPGFLGGGPSGGACLLCRPWHFPAMPGRWSGEWFFFKKCAASARQVAYFASLKWLKIMEEYRAARVAGKVLGIAAVAAFLAWIYVLTDTSQLVRRTSARAGALVERVEGLPSGRKDWCRVTARYVAADGQDCTYRFEQGYAPEVGSQVEVFYNPAHPREVRRGNVWMPVLGLGFVWVFLGLLAWAALYRPRKA